MWEEVTHSIKWGQELFRCCKGHCPATEPEDGYDLLLDAWEAYEELEECS